MKAAAVLMVLTVGVAGVWSYLNGPRAFGLSLACFAAAWALAKLLQQGQL